MSLKKYLLNLQYLVFLLIGLALLYMAFKDEDLSAIWSQVVSADYRWVMLALFVTLLNHIVRAARWQMLIRQLGHEVSLWWVFLALMSGYFVNNVIPRLGEITRCGILHRQTKARFSGLLGSVVSERIIDVLTLFLVLGMILLLQFNLISDFFLSNIVNPLWHGLAGRQEAVFTFGLILLGLFGVAGIIVGYYRRQLAASLLYRKARIHGQRFIEGMTVVFHLDKLWLFLLYTFAIWFMYFLMTWLCFFALPATAGLSVMVGFTITGIGSIGRSVPVQAGGMGAYHWILAQALLIYGVAEQDGLAIATIIHAYQTLFYLGLGGICLLAVSVLQRKDSKF